MKRDLALIFIFFVLITSAQNPIHLFEFDASLVNKDQTATFNGTVQYVKDRSGIDKKAIRLNQQSLSANIGNLPQSSASRTISIWIKFNDISNSNYIWGYGAAANNQYCGLIHQGTTTNESALNVAAWGYKNDFVTDLPLATEVWYHYVYVYDGTTSSIYRNGILIENFNAPNRNTLGSVFKIGNINSLVSINADIDELKIYNVALSYDEINTQYNAGALLVATAVKSTSTKGKKATLPKQKTNATKGIALF